MKQKRPASHYILFSILSCVILVGIYTTINLTAKVKGMAKMVSANMKNTMDPKAPDPGKTKPEKYEVGANRRPGHQAIQLDIRILSLVLMEAQ
jgi:hypothetical protein